MYHSKSPVYFLFFFISIANLLAQKPINVIFFIGDGTGLPQISAGNYVNDNHTAFEDFQYIGLSKTHSYDNLVTDSAASGTAMSSGMKTHNRVIGLDENKNPIPNILELCQSNGYKTALIATSTILHATPASFFAKVSSRYKYEEIAFQLTKSEVDYFMGGGKKYFTSRKDNRNLLLEDNTRTYVSSIGEFEKSSAEKIGYFTANDDPKTILEGRNPSLSKMLLATLEKVALQDSPFFIMVEGSQIDWGGHDNDLDYVLSEFKDFNESIQAALDFAKKNKNTLIVVTGDHETGGLAISGGEMENNKIKTVFSTTGHTAIMIPVFSYGPHSEEFKGIYDNTQIFHKFKKSLAFD